MKSKKIAAFATLLIFGIIYAMSTIAWLPIGTGVQPATRDLFTESRYMPVDPGKYAMFIDDFYEFPQATLWDTTSIVVAKGSTFSIVDSLTTWGNLKINYGTNAQGPFEGANLTMLNAPFRLQFSPGKPDSVSVPLEFEARVMFNNVLQSRFIIGLVAQQATASTGLIMNQATGLYFVKYAGSGVTAANAVKIYAKAINANQAASDSVLVFTTSVRQTWYRLKIVWNGKSAKFYVNDVYANVLSTTANFPTAHLHPAIEVCAGDSVANFAYLDYVWVKQKR